ncbi:hypothetical protein OTK49_02095 [Vibrio coralliirubri]|uniref:hypothetical protein n=1 Tax=Vibrio coralliirubri TaxID=1516159 RepID=UPI002284A72F|nr:hypothetical protein [Vibrio coralliirubri]MCY9861306.1 hypothetical protein [Vibrio coralliirubri]
MKSLIQSICGAFVATSLGLTAIAKKAHVRKIILFKLLIILAFIAYKDAPFSEQHMPASPSYSKTAVALQVNAPVISLLDAKLLTKKKKSVIYQVSTSGTHDVNGLNSFHPSEYESLKAAFTLAHSHENIENIILVSHDKNAAYEMANNLKGLPKNVFIVDSGKEQAQLQLDAFFIANTPTNLSTPVSKSDIRLTGNSLHSELINYNVIKLTDGNLLDSGFLPNDKTLDLFSLILSDMKALAADPIWKSPTELMLMFPNGYTNNNMKLISEYLLANIEAAGIPPKVKSAVYMNTSMLNSVFSSSMRVEDFISSPTPANRHELTATAIKSALLKHKDISIVCVAKNCSHITAKLQGVTHVGIPLTISADRLLGDLAQLEPRKSKPIIFVADDMASLNISKNLINYAEYKGFLALGITTSDTLNALANNTADINPVGYAIESMANFMAPEKPFKTTTFLLIAIGFVAALLIETPYKTLKTIGGFTVIYLAYYHHLWISGSHIEYGYTLSIMVTIFMLSSHLLASNREKTTLSKIPTSLALISICGLLAHILMPPIDKLIFGFVFGLSISLFIKNQIATSIETGSKIKGEKYLLTAPLLTGFKGYLVGNGKKLSSLALVGSRKWKIYDNHTTIYGSEAGGFTESVITDRALVNSHINKMSEACLAAGMSARDVQFWVTPSRHNAFYKGVVCSHGMNDKLSWCYALETKDESGKMASISRDICRTTRPTSWLEWQLFYRLKRAELEHGKAVTLTVDISKLFMVVHVVDVEITSTPITESAGLATWRMLGSRAKNRTATIYGEETSSMLNEICNGSIVYGDNFSYLLANQDETFDIQVAHRCMTQFEELITRKDLTKKLAIKEMTKCFAPVLRMKARNYLTLSGEYQDVIMGAINFGKKHSPLPVDIEEPESGMLMLPPPTQEQVVKHLTKMAVTIYKTAR